MSKLIRILENFTKYLLNVVENFKQRKTETRRSCWAKCYRCKTGRLLSYTKGMHSLLDDWEETFSRCDTCDYDTDESSGRHCVGALSWIIRH